MQRFWSFLTDTRTMAVLGLAAIAAFLFLGASTLQIALTWAAILLVIILLIWLCVWMWRKYKARKAANQLSDVIEQQAEKAVKSAAPDKRADVELLRTRMLAAVKTIKTSKLGQTAGASALYELPWYMVIGNPAAGKSTAVVNSGLQFPFAEKSDSVIQGIGGTRNCDWFFTTEGILLDTAGRYSIHDEDRQEWLGFLDLLKKHRPKAPVNGIIVAVSVADLINNRPEFAINLAKNLRQRVQELTERLEVFAPVYVLFTKSDLIAGFTEFFQDGDKQERDRVWGSTLPFDPEAKNQAIAFFDERFDELYEGLKEMSIAHMSLNRGERMPPGILTFPLEFASAKPALRSFLATLFEENPFQFKPIFRGFYFTSALQEGASTNVSSDRIAQRFALQSGTQESAEVYSKNGFFLRDLFSKVIFADRNLVRQYSSRIKSRIRFASFFGTLAAFGLMFAALTWSFTSNRQMVSNVQADLDKAVKLQDGKLDLQSRLEALELLQDRIDQLDRFKENKPMSVGFGLYQGDTLVEKLRAEYYAGLKDVMLKPVVGGIEAFLSEVNARSDKLQTMNKLPDVNTTKPEAATAVAAQKTTLQFKNSSPTSVEDAYNALKTYLMLGDKQRVEAGHLTDQVTRFWRIWLDANRGNMPREQMNRSAEKTISFYLAHVNDEKWPLIENNLTLIDQTRENLQRVVKGIPARERVYSEIKARASTRFEPMTVARIVGDDNANIVAGSYVIPGTFTRAAWDNYVNSAIKDAANKELQSSDWVLKTSTRDDLTLDGSPEQIQKALVGMYKTEYAREWQRFMQGVSVPDFQNFDQAVTHMNRLGDPQNSPINKLINALYEQTSWDNPSLVNEGLKNAQRGIVDWFKQTILRQAPSQINVNVNVNTPNTEIPMGPVGKEFAGVARLVVTKDKDASLLRGYMDALSKVRSRLNQLKNQGDPGPGAKQLMTQTLDASSSELADGLKYVDEQMLTAMDDKQKQTLRPLLLRPLVQSYAVMIRPVELEINKLWNAQVYEPFQNTVSGKYPFSTDSRIEASSAEIGQFFGTEGAIAKFQGTALGALVVRRGDLLTPRTWADLGLSLTPEFASNFGRWVTPLPGSAGAGGGSTATAPQTVFQIQPLPSSGVTEYTIDIDGQILRYRNTPTQWTNFVWPSTAGAPGAKITAITFDGRNVEVANFPGSAGLSKLIGSAQRKEKGNEVNELSWTSNNVNVSVDLRLISTPQPVTRSGGNTSIQGSSLLGVKLPSSVAGNPSSNAAPTPTGAQSK